MKVLIPFRSGLLFYYDLMRGIAVIEIVLIPFRSGLLFYDYPQSIINLNWS